MPKKPRTYLYSYQTPPSPPSPSRAPRSTNAPSLHDLDTPDSLYADLPGSQRTASPRNESAQQAAFVSPQSSDTQLGNSSPGASSHSGHAHKRQHDPVVGTPRGRSGRRRKNSPPGMNARRQRRSGGVLRWMLVPGAARPQKTKPPRRRAKVVFASLVVAGVALVGYLTSPEVHGRAVLKFSSQAAIIRASHQASLDQSRLESIVRGAEGVVGNPVALNTDERSLSQLCSSLPHPDATPQLFGHLSKECLTGEALVKQLIAQTHNDGVPPSGLAKDERLFRSLSASMSRDLRRSSR